MASDAELVPEHHDLQALEVAGAAAHDEDLEDAAQHEVNEMSSTPPTR
jgi:hypothetical protein